MPDKIEITPKFLADLKARAEKATSGPWEYEIHNENLKDKDGKRFGVCVPECGYYIAAASPAAILELVADYERLQKEYAELQDICSGPVILDDPLALTTCCFAGRMAEWREKNREIDRLLEENKQLEKEADWLADYLCELACIRDVKPCNSAKTCRECWRDQARKAVKKKSECPNIANCNRANFSADECNSDNIAENK